MGGWVVYLVGCPIDGCALSFPDLVGWVGGWVGGLFTYLVGCPVERGALSFPDLVEGGALLEEVLNHLGGWVGGLHRVEVGGWVGGLMSYCIRRKVEGKEAV